MNSKIDLDISICIPTYNGQKYLKQAIESGLSQNFEGTWEILVVDDCSSDGTVKIVEEYAQKNPNLIRIIRNNHNQGLVENWNICIQEAKGKWIKFLFQDDLLRIDCLQKMYSFAEANKLGLVLCDRKYIYEEGVSFIQRILPEKCWERFLTRGLRRLSAYFKFDTVLSGEDLSKIYSHNFLGKNFLGEPIAGLFKKELTKDIGSFNYSLKQLVDLEYWLRIGLNQGLGFIPEKLVYFRVHKQATSQKNIKTSVALDDRIILSHLLLESKDYSHFREKLSNKHILKKIKFSGFGFKIIRKIFWLVLFIRKLRNKSIIT